KGPMKYGVVFAHRDLGLLCDRCLPEEYVGQCTSDCARGVSQIGGNDICPDELLAVKLAAVRRGVPLDLGHMLVDARKLRHSVLASVEIDHIDVHGFLIVTGHDISTH